MKNNLITEIQHIKKLMGINESSNEECEDQLQKAGYIVYSKQELRDIDLGCEEKEKIKCVKKWMDDNGISSSRYRIGKYKSYCYIVVQSDDSINQDGKKLKKKTWTFWDNGDVTAIVTFSNLQIDPSDSNLKYSQVQYKGRYECDGSDLNWTDLKYQGVYEFGKYDNLKEIPGTYLINLPDGTKVMVAKIIATNDTFEVYHFN